MSKKKTVLPLHMKKTIDRVEELASTVDLIFEVVDARAPDASRCHIMAKILAGSHRVTVLSKADLADPETTRDWKNHFDSNEIPWAEMPRGKALSLGRFLERALPAGRRPAEGVMLKALVIGIPNVGKSTLINLLTGRHNAHTGAKPGITRGLQLVKIMPGMFVFDTPGVINPVIKSETHSCILGLIGCLQDTFFDHESAAHYLAEKCQGPNRAAFETRYGISIAPGTEPLELIEAIARRRGFLLKGGAPDTERACRALVADFSTGRLAGISLERPAHP